jgi:alkylation response protein AidB-like acyl-CoA dehydrogenase
VADSAGLNYPPALTYSATDRESKRMASFFRSRVRDFLASNDPGPGPKNAGERLDWQRRWAALLVDEGFSAPSWPKEWGGMDLPLSHQVIYHEEFAKVKRPADPGGGIFVVGPTIIKHGTDSQRKRLLRPGLRGDIIWVQGFSEPDAGSDLPSLRTRAEETATSTSSRVRKFGLPTPAMPTGYSHWFVPARVRLDTTESVTS